MISLFDPKRPNIVHKELIKYDSINYKITKYNL